MPRTAQALFSQARFIGERAGAPAGLMERDVEGERPRVVGCVGRIVPVHDDGCSSRFAFPPSRVSMVVHGDVQQLAEGLALMPTHGTDAREGTAGCPAGRE